MEEAAARWNAEQIRREEEAEYDEGVMRDWSRNLELEGVYDKRRMFCVLVLSNSLLIRRFRSKAPGMIIPRKGS